MDALEFLKEKKRMCDSYSDQHNCCGDCPLLESFCVINNVTPDKELKKMIAIVEQWSKDHPRKTRQSVFLEQWPNVITNNGVIDILPCSIDQSLAECNGADCSKCKCEFWMKEVE